MRHEQIKQSEQLSHKINCMGSQTLSLCGFNQLSMFFESNPPIKLDDFRLFNFIILITGAIGMSYSKNWLPHEDEALLQLYQDRRICKWTKINQILAEQFGIKGKSAKKCRQRYNNHLNPQIKRDQWTNREENQLLIEQKEMGNRWAEISRKLPGRTDNSVKNKFYSKFRKAIRNINELSQQSGNGKYKQLQITFIYKLINLIDNKFKSELSISQQLLAAAQNLRDDIISFENLDQDQPNGSTEGSSTDRELSSLMQQVHWINANFKRKAPKRKRRKDSNMKSQKEQKLLYDNQKSPSLEMLHPQLDSKPIDTEKKLPTSPNIYPPSSVQKILRFQGQVQGRLNWAGWAMDEAVDPWGELNQQHSL